MTPSELIDAIHNAGGDLRIAEEQLYVRGLPGELISELRRLKNEVIRHLRFRRMVQRFRLKPVSRQRMREITNGQSWQIPPTRGPRKLERVSPFTGKPPATVTAKATTLGSEQSLFDFFSLEGVKRSFGRN